jgi:hypothetical protein
MWENFKTFLKKNQGQIILSLGIFFAVLALSGFYNLTLSQNRTGELRIEKVAPAALKNSATPEQTEIIQIIGNKNSKIYHFDFCIGAQKMKETNKIFFASIEEAKDAGFRAAKNCPGLK